MNRLSNWFSETTSGNRYSVRNRPLRGFGYVPRHRVCGASVCPVSHDFNFNFYPFKWAYAQKESGTMAKQVAQRTLSIIIHVGSVIWFKDLNRARPNGHYGDNKELLTSMTTRGWVCDEDGTIKAEKISDSLRERAIKELTELWESYKSLAKTDSTKLVDLNVFEEVHVENGKIRVPEFVGVTGNRRDSVFLQAMIARRKENLPITVDVPVIIRHYNSPLERLIDQVGENELKSLGFNPTTDVDKLIAAKEAVEMGAIQSDLRKVFKDGTGQKLWGVIRLNALYPELRIIERMRLKTDDPAYIKLAGVPTKDLPTLVLRSEPSELAAKNNSLALAGKAQLTAATQDEVAAFFAGSTVSDGRNDKVMKGDNIRSLAGNFPCAPVRAMANAIALNQTDALKKYQTNALGFNLLDELIDSGDYPPVEFLLVKIHSMKDNARKALLDRLIAACE